MNIHELYNLKQQQFMQYQVDKGVYDAKLQDAKDELLKAAKELQENLESVDDPRIKTSLADIVNTLTAGNLDFTNDSLASIKAQIDAVANSLESEIRRLLNG